ncbi:hypothetical protein NCU16684 [Neurospora crassa OR74A]|uniref:Uncharacterized protein n=1 Tax=Neurospora crassa (strain ATCC 24698 / 74-OR23-1A / CBS 708.71 / DSM 1257 / FGSC 987) TaxID=367110 RepID=U9W3B6_NEUCR|nr:hypothetical protein NCU16684 [Neurospora crassa OR74A]ESA43371.1 hypothetical protein NCU16684 [Neurospora crassa OR74A]|eukprot:XP_011394057.1 hypothetical protein NCU16684 [Neurospora crassa OR74A]
MSPVRVDIGLVLALVHNPKTLSLLGTLHFVGRSRNSFQAHKMWPPHTRYVILFFFLWTMRVGMRIASRLELLLHHLFWRWRWRHGYRIRGSLLDRVYMPSPGQAKAAPWLTPFIRSLHLSTNFPFAS